MIIHIVLCFKHTSSDGENSLFVYSSICLFIYLFIRLFVYSSIRLFIYSSICVLVYSSIRFFVFLFFFQSKECDFSPQYCFTQFCCEAICIFWRKDCTGIQKITNERNVERQRQRKGLVSLTPINVSGGDYRGFVDHLHYAPLSSAHH